MVQKIKYRYMEIPIQIRASFWFFVSTFISKVTSIIATPVFTRILSTSEYGEYSVYSSWLGIFTVIISLNLSLGVFMRGLFKFADRKEQFASSLQGLTFILIIAWISIYLPFSKRINNWTGLNTIRTLLMIMTIWLTAVFGFWAAEQRIDYQYRKLVPLAIITSISGQGLGIILVQFTNDKVTARILGTVIVYGISYVGLFFKEVIKGKKIICLEFWKYALAFNIPLIPHYLSQTVLNSSDRIMIDKMVGSDKAGIYGLAYSIAQVMGMFNAALLQAEEPWLYRKIEEGNIEDIQSVGYISFIFIAIVNIFLIALAPEVVRIFAPETYFDAIWVIPPIAMSLFFSFSYFFFAIFEYYYEKTKLIAVASCIGAVLNIVLNYLLIPVFGYYVAGYTTLICFVIYALVHYIFMRNICKHNQDGKEPFSAKIYLLIALIFILTGFVFQMMYTNIVIRYIFLFMLLLVSLFNRNMIYSKARKIIAIQKNNK